jgi:hypothetical protein
VGGIATRLHKTHQRLTTSPTRLTLRMPINDSGRSNLRWSVLECACATARSEAAHHLVGVLSIGTFTPTGDPTGVPPAGESHERLCGVRLGRLEPIHAMAGETKSAVTAGAPGSSYAASWGRQGSPRDVRPGSVLPRARQGTMINVCCVRGGRSVPMGT